ncbi:hypothetical protein AB0L75_35180 [Streptomyces sp. NPDC052101]|uniref:hypothetical protein n=1 Tax=Streptomyces sp. NPDC052101 TaxID=3155763 RepID=UPI003413355D
MMIAERATLTTGYVTADLHLPYCLPAPDASHLLPGGWTTSPPRQNTGIHLSVEITDGPGHIHVTDEQVALALTAEAARSTALAFTTYTALERARQLRRMVTVHATAITRHRQAVLILGHKAAGKTTTALALARRGWMHAGDDLVVLGEAGHELLVMPGKPTAAVRPAATDAFYQPKPVVDLRDAFETEPSAVALVVRVAVHPNSQTLVAPATPFSTAELLRLHENLARYITGLPTPINGLTGTPVATTWPLDTPQCATWRAELIRALERSRYVYLHAPTAEAAADLIEGLMP